MIEDVAIEKLESLRIESKGIEKYDSEMSKYKHTFKKDKNGNYYWLSSEPI